MKASQGRSALYGERVPGFAYTMDPAPRSTTAHLLNETSRIGAYPTGTVHELL